MQSNREQVVDYEPQIRYNVIIGYYNNIIKERGKGMKKEQRRWLEVGVLLLVLTVCIVVWRVGYGKTGEQQGTEVSEQTEVNNDEPAKLDKSLYMDAGKDTEERVAALLSQMTTEEKVAQMIQPEQSAISYSDITKYGIGSVLSGGGSAPASGNTAQDWQTHINQIKQAALESRLGIPVLYGVDAVHGHNNVYGATIYPHNIGLGCANDEDLMERIGEAVASEVRATGIQWTFAPTLGNARNELWGRTYECFGEDAELVAKLGGAFVRGVQGTVGSEEYLDNTRVLATAKHYIGEGYTLGGINQGDVVMPDEEFETLLREELLAPYREAIEAGVRTVMVSFSGVNGLKCHEDKYLITDVLKGDLGFTGLVVSDYNGVQQVTGNSYKEKIANGINAGIDLFMEPNSWQEFIAETLSLIEEGDVSMERIDDAVSRILRVKFEAGLFEEEIGQESELMEAFGGEEHRTLAREAVAKSLVLLKNDTIGEKTAMEVLAESKNILVAGGKADDIGAQCGGWTISWQGSTGDITEGTTILEGLEQAVGDDVTIDYSAAGEVDAKHDAVIVVVGENPYAESSGDRSTTNLTITGTDKQVLQTIKETAAAAGNEDVPIIAVLVSGRAITIADQIDDFDALVMAWLPGTEGAGVADVLLGEQEFTGTLTYTWTWYASDIEGKFEAENEDKILFKKGSGLKKDGSSITDSGTKMTGEKPTQSEDEMAASAGNGIDLASVGYVLEAENFTSDSYLVKTGNANNISYVDNWGTEWANAKWDVWVPKEGSYRLHFKIAAAKDSSTVAIYYASPTIEDDGNANRTVVPMKATKDLNDYQDVTLDVVLDKGSYQFKLMTDTTDGADFRLDNIEFEYLD